MQASGVGQEEHHQHGDDGAHQQVRLAPAHLAPGAVTVFANQGLDNHPHQRGKNPEERKLVRVCAQGGEDTADIGALQGIGNLHPEKAKAEIYQLTEG